MSFNRPAWDVWRRAPAKVNLYFELLARRDDGFHEVETLMVPITLFDDLCFSATPAGPIQLDARWATGDPTLGLLPANSDNLVVKALELLRQAAGITQGARVSLLKRIPLAAGLGGGSSDAAAALLAGNRGWKLNWTVDRLQPLAAQLGSDVPFFLENRPALCLGRGEQVVPVGSLPPLPMVVVRPPQGLATAEVYRRCQVPPVPRCSRDLLHSLGKGDLRKLSSSMVNRLEPAAEQLTPWVQRLRCAFGQVNCVAHQMSGSGSSYFGIFHSFEEARRAARRLRARNVGVAVAVSSWCRVGAER